MRITEGSGSGRPAAVPRGEGSPATGKGHRAQAAPSDGYEVVPRSPWSPQPQGFRAHLPPEDPEAICEDPPPVRTNPKLAAFLEQHDDIVTNQDFISYWWNKGEDQGEGGWKTLERACSELGIDVRDVANYRSAAIRDLAYPPPPPDGSLPLSAEEADRFHIVQFTNDPYNPTGPGRSMNCGPASLAMALDTQGKMPRGLTPEQKVDYARALMFPDDPDIQHIQVQGQEVAQLDRDSATTGNGDIETGAEEAGLAAEILSGWDQLDQALREGKPMVAFGDCYEDWKKEFPDRDLYGRGEIAHFIAILGKTAGGNYIVSDPMYRGGSVEMTREQLAVFFNKDGDNTPGFVAIEGTGEPPSAPVQDAQYAQDGKPRME